MIGNGGDAGVGGTGGPGRGSDDAPATFTDEIIAGVTVRAAVPDR